MITTGFGNLTDELESVTTVGKITNRNAIIQLSAKQEKRVTDIVAGYSIIQGSAVTFFEGGRLLVVGTRFDAVSALIDPRSKNLPDELGSATVYLDVMFANSYPLTNETPRFEYHSSKGIHVPKGTDCSIILTFAITDDAAYPVASLHNAYLNVDGFAGGSDAPFKNIR